MPKPLKLPSLKEIRLQLKFWQGSLFYATYAPQAYLYSRKRDRLERLMPPETSASFEHPGKLLRVVAQPSGAQFTFEQAMLEVCCLTPDFVRVNWQPGLEPIPYAIVQSVWSPVETTLAETSDGWTLTSSALQVWVSHSGCLKFSDATGQTLREELPPQRNGLAWSHQVKLRSEERIYGLGERAAPFNLRLPKTMKRKNPDTGKEETIQEPAAYRMWNYDAAGMYGSGSDPMYLCIPVYLSLHDQGSHLVFYENSFEATFTFEDVASIEFAGGALRYYVAIGAPTQLLARYTTLTGRAPLPPRWALGYHQSRWGYRTEQAVRETVHQFRDLELPLSAIHMDIDAQSGFRAFTIDPDRFPKLGSFTRELAAEGVQFISIINPGVQYSRKDRLYLEGRALDAFCKTPDGELIVGPVWPGRCVFPDFTNPLVRRWWSRQYEYLLDLGLAGFWHDMNEPAVFILWGDRSLPKVVQHHMEGRGGDHREAHNLYGFLQAKAGFESLCEYRPQQRPFIVSRSGWAGLQRYAWTWTGDIECTWSALRQTIPMVIGMGLSGIPYTGPDIGGFQGNPSAELYLRWFQLSTFLPFYRSHCSNNVEYRAPWTYGEPYLSMIRQLLQLRYRLMPYFYTLSWQTSQTGYPLVRPVFWADPTDARLWNVDDAFLLGDALLVCPVGREGDRSRSVTLPHGHWYNFWTDALMTGGGNIRLEAPLEQLPLLVKAGSLLPMESGEHLTLHLYPPVEGTIEGLVYSDAGDGYGEQRLDRFWLTRTPEGLELTWETQGEYVFPYTSVQIQVHGMTIAQAWIDGTAATVQDNRFASDRLFQQARLKTS
jgi:alpha-glucosidase